MPRKAAVVNAASVSVPARGRGKATVAKKAPAVENPIDVVSDVEVPPCPICCEPRDATDMEFYPCSCGYQLCLFCYKRLKNEFAGQCPACRAPYDVDPEDCKRIIQSKASETSKSHIGSTSGSFKQHREQTLPHSYPPQNGLTVQIPPPPPPPPPKPEPSRKALEIQMQQRQDSSFTSGTSDSFTGLPSGATWATPHLSRTTTQELDVAADSAVDESAWPALSESLPSQATTPVRQSSLPNHTSDTHLSRKLSSTTTPTTQQFTDTASTSNAIQPQTSDPTSQRKFHTAQVTSMVSGIRRAVCVPLELPPNSTVEPVPEAAAVLPNVKAAVREGRISSADGAHQLVTLLRQTERSNRPSLLQAGRLPPGFADPAYRQIIQPNTTEDARHNHLQPAGRLGGTVVDLPTDRSTLHSPFQHSSNTYHSNHYPSTSGTSLEQSGSFVQPTDDVVAPAGHSMWQSTCLPGLDMSSSLRAAVPVNVSAIWGQDPADSHSAASTSMHDPQISSKPPPPGFGPLLHSKHSAGANGYHPQLSPSADASRVWLHGQNSLGNGSYASRYVPPGIGAVGSARPSVPPPYRPLDFQTCIKSDFPRAPGTKT